VTQGATRATESKKPAKENLRGLLILSRAREALDRERTSATATTRRIRIVESKPGTLEGSHVVDLDPRKVLHAEWVDENPQAVHVDHQIIFGRLIFNIETVLEARTSAWKNPDP
jgi:hypothetical protein